MKKTRNAEVSKRAVELFDHDTEFPGFVFLNRKWKTQVFNGIPFFESDARSLETFLTFVQAQNNDAFTVCSQHPTKTIMDKGEGTYTCLWFTAAQLNQADFKNTIAEASSFNAVSWYLFAGKGDWGIYIDTHFDIYVVGYDAAIETGIQPALAGEPLLAGMAAIENKLAENISNKELLKKQADEIGKNYFKIPKRK